MTPFIADSEVKMPDNVTGNDDAIVEGNKWRHKLPSQQFVISLEKKQEIIALKFILRRKFIIHRICPKINFENIWRRGTRYTNYSMK